MTKRKPDTVTEFRISLQDKQSEQLDDIVTAYMIGNVLPSVVRLINDVTGMAVVLSILAGIIGFTFIAGKDLDAPGLIDAFLTQREQAIAAGLIITAPGPLGPGLGIRLAELLGLLPEQDQNGGGGGGGF